MPCFLAHYYQGRFLALFTATNLHQMARDLVCGFVRIRKHHFAMMQDLQVVLNFEDLRDPILSCYRPILTHRQPIDMLAISKGYQIAWLAVVIMAAQLVRGNGITHGNDKRFVTGGAFDRSSVFLKYIYQRSHGTGMPASLHLGRWNCYPKHDGNI
jgi:hypothetical protein